jgi:hypothetical protein
MRIDRRGAIAEARRPVDRWPTGRSAIEWQRSAIRPPMPCIGQYWCSCAVAPTRFRLAGNWRCRRGLARLKETKGALPFPTSSERGSPLSRAASILPSRLSPTSSTLPRDRAQGCALWSSSDWRRPLPRLENRACEDHDRHRRQEAADLGSCRGDQPGFRPCTCRARHVIPLRVGTGRRAEASRALIWLKRDPARKHDIGWQKILPISPLAAAAASRFSARAR